MPKTMKKTNMDRLLSLAVRIKDPEAAKEVWESFKDAKLLAGCQILSMGNGNYAEERDKIDELLTEIHEWISRYHLGDAKAEALLDKIEVA